MLIKLGEALQITQVETIDSINMNQAVLERFQKFAQDLKRIAPKANDFIYFSAVMLHAAEASAHRKLPRASRWLRSRTARARRAPPRPQAAPARSVA